MKKTLTISTVVLALGAGAAGIALAGPGGKGFDRLDADSNGVVTMEEAKAAGSKHFAKLDKDKSGGLTADEIGHTWHVARGLLTTRSTSLDTRRIRGVTIHQPVPL